MEQRTIVRNSIDKLVQQRFSNQFIEIIKMSNHSLGPSAVSYVETVSI